MATDYAAPRRPTAELDSDGGDDLDGLVRRGAAKVTPLVEDEAILGDSLELPGADLSDQSVDDLVPVVPQRPGEFRCGNCYLMLSRTVLARETGDRNLCRDCA